MKLAIGSSQEVNQHSIQYNTSDTRKEGQDEEEDDDDKEIVQEKRKLPHHYPNQLDPPIREKGNYSPDRSINQNENKSSFCTSSSSCSSEEITTSTVPLFNSIYLPSNSRSTVTKYQKQPFLICNNSQTFTPSKSTLCKKVLSCSSNDLLHSSSKDEEEEEEVQPEMVMNGNHYDDELGTDNMERKNVLCTTLEEIQDENDRTRNHFDGSTTSPLTNYLSSSLDEGESCDQHRLTKSKSNLSWTTGSIIYALSLVILSCFFYLLDLTKKTNGLHQVFK